MSESSFVDLPFASVQPASAETTVQLVVVVVVSVVVVSVVVVAFVVVAFVVVEVVDGTLGVEDEALGSVAFAEAVGQKEVAFGAFEGVVDPSEKAAPDSVALLEAAGLLDDH